MLNLLLTYVEDIPYLGTKCYSHTLFKEIFYANYKRIKKTFI